MTKLVAAACAAAVAVTLLPGCAASGSAPSGSPTSTAPSPSAPVAEPTTRVASAEAPSHKTVAWHRVRQVLDEAPVLPGSRAFRRAPDPALARPMQTIASPNLVTATRWWTAPGTVEAALDYLRTHAPARLRASGHGAFLTSRVTVRGLMFDGRSTGAYRELILIVAVTRHGAGVAVRADAQAVWVPARTPAEHIDPTTLTSVDVTVTRPEVAPTVHRAVTGARAGALAAVVNGLPARTPGPRGCLRDLGYVDTLVFHGAGPDVVVRASATGCTVAQVSVSGRWQPALAGGGVVDRAVLKVLGLPPSYR